jgi:hypothetical protein
VLLQVQHGQKSERVGLVPAHFDGRPDQRLRQDQVGQRGQVEQPGILVEELAQQGLQALKIDRRLRVKPLELDLDLGDVLGIDQSDPNRGWRVEHTLSLSLSSLSPHAGPRWRCLPSPISTARRRCRCVVLVSAEKGRREGWCCKW